MAVDHPKRDASASLSGTILLLLAGVALPGACSASGTKSSDGPTGGSGGAADMICEGKLCRGQCVRLDDPQAGCAGPDCGSCPTLPHSYPVCSAGACGSTCITNWLDCNADPADGCEINVYDPANCGGCGRACALPNVAAHTCDTGTCQIKQCASGYVDADGNAENGCEVTTGSLCSMPISQFSTCPASADGLACAVAESCFACERTTAQTPTWEWFQIDSESCWTSSDAACVNGSIVAMRGHTCTSLGSSCRFSLGQTTKAILKCISYLGGLQWSETNCTAGNPCQ